MTETTLSNKQSIVFGVFGSADTKTIVFMLVFNSLVMIGLCLWFYFTHNWEAKTIHQEVRETNMAEVEERYDQRARDAFFLNQESAQESLLLHSQFRDQSTILMKGRKKKIMPVLDLTAINRPLHGIGSY